jgi:hypothetical protein
MTIDIKAGLKQAERELEDLGAKNKFPKAAVDLLNKSTQLEPPPTQRNKELFYLLTTSAADDKKIAMILHFIKNILPKLNDIFIKYELTSRDFGYKNLSLLLKDFESKLLTMTTKAKTIEEFSIIRKRESRKIAFIGRFLFERYTKKGRFNNYLLETSESALYETNKLVVEMVKKGGKYIMRDTFNSPIEVKSPFKNLIPTEKILIEQFNINNEKIIRESLDYAPLAINEEGLINFPTPADFKLVAAAKKATRQHIKFLKKIQDAINNKQKVIIQIEDIYLEQIKNKPGIGKIEKIKDSDLYSVELDPEKIIFDMHMKDRMLITPDPKKWNLKGRVEYETAEIGMISTTKNEKFNYWIIIVPINMEPLEEIYKALFE